ncbi:DNA-binding protein [Gemmatimonadetes bacterium T265]|nr:DNA-binding protein [Gemmatimonadetes bacterium T265]
MSRAQRLLDLLQLLRCHRYPVPAAAIAAELGVSPRTLYRDVATLRAQGARVEGAPGLGYVLRPGFTLPPLTFTEDEVDALVLGARWVVDRADAPLGAAARHAVAKIRAVLPTDRRQALDDTTLLVGPGAPLDGGSPAERAVGQAELTVVRRAIRAERKLTLTYRDLRERESVRTIWPFALTFFDRARVVVGWCELRGGFRHFRADRIAALTPLDARYPRRRDALLREWRAAEQIPARATDTI